MRQITQFLKEYDGTPLRLMEVCGTHTAAIAQTGLRSLLSPRITLVSGPGCPVCVTVTSYIDRLVELSMEQTVVTFGDMLRVPGSRMSLNDARAVGGHVQMVYSPIDALRLAAKQREERFVFAAVGFETTAPIYAMLLEHIRREGITNLSLLTSLKTMPPVINWICANQNHGIDGFLAPGHVSVVTGSNYFIPLSEKYKLPFAVAGFDGLQLLAAVYTLVQRQGQSGVVNLYQSAVTPEGNRQAQQMVQKYFEPCAAAWRGIGMVANSGLVLRPEYEAYDAGSSGLEQDNSGNKGCCCAQVLTGRLQPEQCLLFGSACTPSTPQGACMVSQEGSCFHHFNSRK